MYRFSFLVWGIPGSGPDQLDPCRWIHALYPERERIDPAIHLGTRQRRDIANHAALRLPTRDNTGQIAGLIETDRIRHDIRPTILRRIRAEPDLRMRLHDIHDLRQMPIAGQENHPAALLDKILHRNFAGTGTLRHMVPQQQLHVQLAARALYTGIMAMVPPGVILPRQKHKTDPAPLGAQRNSELSNRYDDGNQKCSHGTEQQYLEPLIDAVILHHCCHPLFPHSPAAGWTQSRTARK